MNTPVFILKRGLGSFLYTGIRNSMGFTRCGTISRSNWQHSASLYTKRMQMLESNDFNGYNALSGSLNRRRVWINEHPEYFLAKAQGLADFWTVVALPFGGYAVLRGSYRAAMWAYRNPVIVTEVSFDFVGSLLPGSPASSYPGVSGFAASYIYGYEKW